MTKTILLTFTLLSCSAWMAAQSTSPSTSAPDTSSAPSSQSSAGQSGADASGNMSGSETTIAGCLNSAGGGYTLTDASGTTYQLSGDTSKLSSRVNNQVELKGTASGSASGSAGSSASASSGAASGQTFNVTKVKKIASTCSNTK